MPLASPEIQAFATGFPIALLHAAMSIVLLVAGAAVYALLTPYKDVQLIREGNPAAALSFGGALVALAIPLAAALAGSASTVDVALWGFSVVVIQLLLFRLTDMGLKGLPQRMQDGDVAAAALLVAAKTAIALVLAAAVLG